MEKINFPVMAQKTCRVANRDLLKKIGRAQFQTLYWGKKISELQKLNRDFEIVDEKIKNQTLILQKKIPQSRSLISRLKKIIEGNLGSDHSDVKILLVKFLRDSARSVRERLEGL